jgi:hypothetical protein
MAIDSQRDAKFEANGKREGDHGVPQPGKLSEPADQSLLHLQIFF